MEVAATLRLRTFRVGTPSLQTGYVPVSFCETDYFGHHVVPHRLRLERLSMLW